MKLTVKLFMASLVIAGLAMIKPVTAAPQTWTGSISDAMCNGAHGDKGGRNRKIMTARSPAPRRLAAATYS
jgi:hypothetical protein